MLLVALHLALCQALIQKIHKPVDLSNVWLPVSVLEHFIGTACIINYIKQAKEEENKKKKGGAQKKEGGERAG